MVDFDGMPDSARVWVFGVGRSLEPTERNALLSTVDAFVASWAAHGHPLAAARAWVEERFLIIAVDDRITPPSGCSIDALVRTLSGIETELGTTILGHERVWYRGEDGAPVPVSRPRFRALAGEGTITHETRVFDPSLTRLAELRDGRFEGPAAERWHARLLGPRG